MLKNLLLILMIIISLSVPAFAGFQNIEQNQSLLYKSIASAGNVVVKSGAGYLHTIVITGGSAGTINVFDSTGAGTSNIANFSSTNTPNTYLFDVGFSSGCTVTTGAATNLTVSYL